MKLIIINGVTGAIGSACLSLFASQNDTVVYGISRKAKDFRNFCIDGKLPQRTLVCSIYGRSPEDDYPARTSCYFSEAINSDLFESIYYIHALGVYPFEIDESGDRIVRHDNDQDGIDDRCTLLTRDMFNSFYTAIPSATKKQTHSFIFGAIADKYEPFVHISWWKTMKELKSILIKSFKESEKKSTIGNSCKVSVVSISSVLCPNELISRPFVFSKTDSDPHYWLRPEEVARFVASIINIGQSEKFKEYEFFKKKPDFNSNYYEDKYFTHRKIVELFGK